MELQTALEGRRSIRRFQDSPVSAETLACIADAAAMAPSWKNSQVTRYYAVTDPEKRRRIIESMPAFNRPACESAPVIVAVSMVRNRSGYDRDGSFSTSKEKGWQMFDCGCSAMAFALKAHELGLGTVIMGYCDEAVAVEVTGMPETEEVGPILALGYPDESPQMPKRKMSDQILHIL